MSVSAGMGTKNGLKSDRILDNLQRKKIVELLQPDNVVAAAY